MLLHVQRALTLLDALQHGAGEASTLALHWRLRKVREATLDLQGKRPEQRVDLDAMDQLAEALNVDRLRAYAAWRRSVLAQRTADWATQEASARRGVLLAERAADDEARLSCQRLVAIAMSHQGDWRTGQVMAQDVLAQACGLGLRNVQAHCLNTLGFIADVQHDVVAALELFQQTLEINRETGNQRDEAFGLGNVGMCWAGLGALTQARKASEEALQMCRANGDRTAECAMLCNLSYLALMQVEDARALSLARAALEIALAVEARNMEVSALICLGDAELALGRYGPAQQAFGQAHAVVLAIEHPGQHDATVGQARLAMAQADVRAALQQVNSLLLHADNGGNFEGVSNPRLLELTCYQVLAKAGDPRAQPWLERAHTALQSTAKAITNAALRHGLLANIPEHREIVAAWAASERSSGGTSNTE